MATGAKIWVAKWCRRLPPERCCTSREPPWTRVGMRSGGTAMRSCGGSRATLCARAWRGPWPSRSCRRCPAR
eukprot:10922021-Alexandrium_andersonii.AAC.1